MPIQEALVTDPALLDTPCGVSFEVPGDKFGTKALDRRSWAAELEATRATMEIGHSVVALIQTRSTRPWNQRTRQYDFKPDEDYLVSAWLVSEEAGTHYRAGTVLQRWFGEVNEALEIPHGNVEGELYNFWNCHPTSCKLSRNGPTFLITNFRGEGGVAEAISLAKRDFVNLNKFGWRGGSFTGAWQSSPGRGNARVSPFRLGRRIPMAGGAK